MAMQVHIDVDDTRPDGLDSLRDTLAQTYTVPDVIEIRERLFHSVFHRIKVLRPTNPQHIPGGSSIPTFFHRGIALCEARLTELRAEQRQASRGAIPGIGREGKADANGRDDATEVGQCGWGHDQAPDRMGDESGEAVPGGTLPSERWLVG